MVNAGFEIDNLSTSWLLIKELTPDIELWFEVWGEGEDDYSIEVLKKNDVRPYMSIYIKPYLEKEMLRLQSTGVISGYERGDTVFRFQRYNY